VRFSSARSAYEWAYWDILKPWRDGRCNHPDPDIRGGSDSGIGNHVLLALSIEMMLERTCHSACPMHSKDCILAYWFPDPLQPSPVRTQSEVDRIEGCIKEFEDRLDRAGLLE